MMPSSGIYLIVNRINGHRYVGLSSRLEKRWMEHRTPKMMCRDHVLARAMRKHGKENFSFEVLEECAVCDLPSRERHWISVLKPEYNMNAGGLGNSGRKLPPESIEKIRQSLKRRWMVKSDSEKAAIVARLTRRPNGHPVSPTTRELIRSKLTGTRWSESRRNAQPKHYNFRNRNGNKRITCLSLGENRVEGRMFPSVREAAAFFGVHPESISVILRRGGVSRRLGFYFEKIKHNN